MCSVALSKSPFLPRPLFPLLQCQGRSCLQAQHFPHLSHLAHRVGGYCYELQLRTLRWPPHLVVPGRLRIKESWDSNRGSLTSELRPAQSHSADSLGPGEERVLG